MSHKNVIAVVCFAVAVVSALVFCFTGLAVAGPMVARGTGPNGVQVSAEGIARMVLSFLAAGGFTVAGFWAWLAREAKNLQPEKIRDVVETLRNTTSLKLSPLPPIGVADDLIEQFNNAKSPDEQHLIRELAWLRVQNDFLAKFGLPDPTSQGSV